jgi:cysteine-rich repeat protein
MYMYFICMYDSLILCILAGCDASCKVESSLGWTCDPPPCRLDTCSCSASGQTCAAKCDAASDCDSRGYCNGLGTCDCFKGYEPKSGSKRCAPRCGDGIVVDQEECDPPGPGCSSTCKVMMGWSCAPVNQSDMYSSTSCTSVCGDNYLAVGGETCDDGNDVPGDGCDESCMAEDGWACTQEGGCRRDVCQCEGYCAEEQCLTCTKTCGTDNDCGEGFCDDRGACQVRG